MQEYHKIHSIYKRYTPDILAELQAAGKDISGLKKGEFIWGDYSRPEFELLKDITWQFTEKVDGTNVRIGYGNEAKTHGYTSALIQPKVFIGGRTSKAQMPLNLVEKLTELFPLEKMQKQFGELEPLDVNDPKIVLYGEGYGARIQKGGGDYISDGVGFILFDVRVGHMWLRRDSVEEIGEKLGIPVVPVIGEGTLEDGIKMCQEGFPSKLKTTSPEGIIAKPKMELLDRRGLRIITKIKLCDFKR